MKSLYILAAGVAALALAGCGSSDPEPTINADAPPIETPAAVDAGSELHPSLVDVAAATYSLEKTHAFLTFKVGHAGGISQYRVNFTDFDAKLDFDPAAPEAATLSVTINPLGLQTNYPGDYKAGHADSPYETWNEDVARNERWLNADNFPTITFVSTGITRTGDTTGTVTGDLTFLGQTKPVTLDVTYNGSANAPWFGERDLIGFDAATVITRSEWGMSAFIPNIGDEVTVEFSGEFLQDE